MDYKKMNDYEILYMVKENDEYSRNLMFKKYEPIVKNIASKYYTMFKNNGSDYEDFVQEGFIALNKAINCYNQDSDALFYTYATLCVNRQIITYCRNLTSKKHFLLNSSVRDEMLYDISSSVNYIENYVDEIINEEEFINIKNMFSIKHSSVFELRFNGFCYKEISELLDIPISTVDSRLGKIKKILQTRKEKIFY